ncbi:MAG: hypothetical protein ACOX2K_05850 [Bacillota bacterium]
MANSLVWVLLFILAAIAMLVLVPRRDVIKLLPFGVVGGFLLALAVQWVAIHLLRIWRFNFTQFASYRGIPLFLALSWVPATIIFGYWLRQIRSNTGRFFFIAAFALGTVLLEWAFVLTGYRTYLRYWNVFYTAILALVLHYLLAWYLLATRQVADHAGKVVPLKE